MTQEDDQKPATVSADAGTGPTVTESPAPDEQPAPAASVSDAIPAADQSQAADATKEAFEDAQAAKPQDQGSGDAFEMLAGLVEVLGAELARTNERVDDLEKRLSAVARSVANVS